MQVQGAYDLVVIGDQLAGLFLAAGAAQKGWRVLVLEGNATPSVIHEAPSGRFLGDLIAEPMIGLETNGRVDQFFKNLGLYSEVGELFFRHELEQQIIAKKFRIPFQASAGKLETELLENSQLDSKQIHALSLLLTGSGNAKTKFSEFARQSELGVEVESLATIWSSVYGSMAANDINLGQYRSIIEKMEKGVLFPIGGRNALKERLLSKVNVFGGTVKKSAWVEEIVFEYGRLTGVMLSTYEGFVKSPRVVGAMGAKNFLQLVPQEVKPEYLVKSVNGISSKYWRLNFCLVLPEEVIPEGLFTNAVSVSLGDDLAEDRFLHLQCYGKEMFGGIAPDHKALIVRVLVPFEKETLQKKYLARLIQRSMEKVEALIPYLKTQPYQLHPSYVNFETDQVLERFYQWKDLDFIPPIFRVYNRSLTDSMESLDFLNWSRFGLHGMALCSRDIRPMFGLYGEVETAMDLLESEFFSRREK